MINNVVETWHGIISGANPEALNDLLADDVVFYSPWSSPHSTASR